MRYDPFWLDELEGITALRVDGKWIYDVFDVDELSGNMISFLYDEPFTKEMTVHLSAISGVIRTP